MKFAFDVCLKMLDHAIHVSTRFTLNIKFGEDKNIYFVGSDVKNTSKK